MKKTLVVLATALTLSSCKGVSTAPGLMEAYNDKIISHTYTKKWGSAMGQRGIYIVYGTNPEGLKEGTALDFTHRWTYRIKDLLSQNPTLASEKALAAQVRQEKTLGERI